MKHFFLYLFLLLGFTSKAQTTPNEGRAEKIEALYVAYMTRELKLTEEDAQKFWPVHALYDDEIKALRKESAGQDELGREQAILNIKKKYQERFIKILGPQRTNDFFVKDSEFRKKLTERLMKMRQQNQNNPKTQRQSLQRNSF